MAPGPSLYRNPFPPLLLLALLLWPGGSLAAQDSTGGTPSGGEISLVESPPRGPSAMAAAERIQLRPTIDGVMDEPFWSELQPVADFVQRDPVDGGVPSERTEVRIAYDEDFLYFGFHLFDSDPSGIRANILHRGGMIGFDDHVVIGLDTFQDRRNGYIFEINALGTQDDAIFTDESIEREDWNWDGVYWSEARIHEGGWTLEVAIPFTTIRFPREEVLEMGLLFYRSIRRKNETVFWPHLPATYRGRYAQASQYGTLTGLRGVVPGRNLQVKPFVVSGGQKAGVVAPTNGVLETGLDVKYSLTSSLTLDLTVNTDFAQVEADNVQVNLDRFSLFFPEKREFFLERAGLFAFGEAGQTQLFFSRRIGLQNPILGGGRLTGQVGPVSLGLLNLQTGDDAGGSGANNSVARVRADLGPRASVGGLVTNLQGGGIESRSAGADAQLRFFGSSSFDVWAARVWPGSEPAGTEGMGLSAGSVQLQLRNATLGAAAGFTSIGEGFNPALGFVRRTDQRRWEGELAFTPRFDRSPWARQLSVTARGLEVDGQDGIFQTGRRSLDTQFTFQSGDGLGSSVVRNEEAIPVPFAIRPGVVIPVGSYTFTTGSANIRTNGSRPVFVNASVSNGNFYNGTRTQVDVSGGITVSPRLSFQPSFAWNDVELPVEGGNFTTRILSLNVKSALNRSLFGDALLQYDDVSERLQANIRVNWIHTPGSNLFLVLDTGVNTGELLEPGQTRWERRTGVVKLTYMWAL